MSALSDRDGDRLRERLELAAPGGDRQLPVARDREGRAGDRVMERADPLERDVQRPEVLGRQACGELRLRRARGHAFRGEEVEVDDVRARSGRLDRHVELEVADGRRRVEELRGLDRSLRDRKSTRLNSSHVRTSYAVFCLKKKKKKTHNIQKHKLKKKKKT